MPMFADGIRTGGENVLDKSCVRAGVFAPEGKGELTVCKPDNNTVAVFRIGIRIRIHLPQWTDHQFRCINMTAKIQQAHHFFFAVKEVLPEGSDTLW